MILAAMQFVILLVNSLGGNNPIFPKEAQFYSDFEIPTNIRNADDAWIATSEIFRPSTGNVYIDTVSIGAFGALLIVGIAISWKAHSMVPLAFIFLLYIFFNMFSKSIKFMNKMFYNWDNSSMIYMAILFGVMIFTIFIITLAETPTHGKSG